MIEVIDQADEAIDTLDDVPSYHAIVTVHDGGGNDLGTHRVAVVIDGSRNIMPLQEAQFAPAKARGKPAARVEVRDQHNALVCSGQSRSGRLEPGDVLVITIGCPLAIAP